MSIKESTSTKNYSNSHSKNIKVAKYMPGAEYSKFLKDRYNEYKKDMKVQGKKPLPYIKYIEPFPKKVKDYRSK